MLVATETDFSAVMLDRWSRERLTEEQRAAERERVRLENAELEAEIGIDLRENPSLSEASQREFSYEEDQFENWVMRMQAFLLQHTSTEPQYLPPPDPNQRRLESGSPFDDLGGNLDSIDGDSGLDGFNDDGFDDGGFDEDGSGDDESE